MIAEALTADDCDLPSASWVSAAAAQSDVAAVAAQPDKPNRRQSTMNHVHVEREIGGRPYRIETGKVAKLASGAVLIRHGDTEVMASAMQDEQKARHRAEQVYTQGVWVDGS